MTRKEFGSYLNPVPPFESRVTMTSFTRAHSSGYGQVCCYMLCYRHRKRPLVIIHPFTYVYWRVFRKKRDPMQAAHELGLSTVSTMELTLAICELPHHNPQLRRKVLRAAEAKERPERNRRHLIPDVEQGDPPRSKKRTAKMWLPFVECPF